jgi:hypothetical protein
MRKDVVLAVADAIENHSRADLGFNMGHYISHADWGSDGDKSGHNCGTVACVAGWTVAIFNEKGEKRDLSLSILKRLDFDDTIVSRATDAMDIHSEDAEQLFHPADRFTWESITPAKAASVLRHFAETGMVEWT